MKHRLLFIISLLILFSGCSEVEKQLNESQSINSTCPVIEEKSNILLENNRNKEEVSKLISSDSSSNAYRHQIINFALSQLYFSPQSTTVNSHTLLFAKVDGREFFINSIPQDTYDFSFINAIEKLAKFYKKPLAIKSRLELIEKRTSEYIYASKSLEEFIKDNQGELFTKKNLKKLYFRGAQGVRENELFQRVSYLKRFNRLKRISQKKLKTKSYSSDYLFTRGNYSCSFDNKLHEAQVVILKKPKKSYNNIFAHFKNKNNYIIGVTSSIPDLAHSVNEIIFSNFENDNYPAVCFSKSKEQADQVIFMSGITYNAQVLNTLIKSYVKQVSPEELMNTKRSLLLHNPKRRISEIYGKSIQDASNSQYYAPSLGSLTILELGSKLSTYIDPRNKQLACQ